MEKEAVVNKCRKEEERGECTSVIPELRKIDELRTRFGITKSDLVAKVLRIPEERIWEIMETGADMAP